MNVAIFGGTFDPVHRGHIAIARAAQKAYRLGRIYFVPADIQPLKRQQAVTPYYHRFAMLALATQGEKQFIPSLMEAPGEEARRTPSFTIDTVRRFRALLPRSNRLFFLVGIDAFLQISVWREPEALLREVEFIIASRPGFSLADIAEALPETLRPKAKVTAAFRHHLATGDLAIGSVTLHILADVAERASATAVRQAARSGRSVARYLDNSVADYIRKMHLYKAVAQPRANQRARKVISIRARKA